MNARSAGKRGKLERLVSTAANLTVLVWLAVALFAGPRAVEIVTGALLLLGAGLLLYDNEGVILRRIVSRDERIFPLPRPLVWPLASFLCFLGGLFLVGAFTIRPGGLLPM